MEECNPYCDFQYNEQWYLYMQNGYCDCEHCVSYLLDLVS